MSLLTHSRCSMLLCSECSNSISTIARRCPYCGTDKNPFIVSLELNGEKVELDCSYDPQTLEPLGLSYIYLQDNERSNIVYSGRCPHCHEQQIYDPADNALLTIGHALIRFTINPLKHLYNTFTSSLAEDLQCSKCSKEIKLCLECGNANVKTGGWEMECLHCHEKIL